MFEEIKNYVYAGNSTFILSNAFHKFYFNVKQSKDNFNVYYVYNVDPRTPRLYLGKVIKTLQYPFVRECKEYGRRDVEMIEVFLNNLFNDAISLNMTFAKAHTCAECGKLLTDPKSIKLGYGPECRKKYNKGE